MTHIIKTLEMAHITLAIMPLINNIGTHNINYNATYYYKNRHLNWHTVLVSMSHINMKRC